MPRAVSYTHLDVYKRQMYKHWDEWVTTAPHPFIADFDGNGISNVVDILDVYKRQVLQRHARN